MLWSNCGNRWQHSQGDQLLHPKWNGLLVPYPPVICLQLQLFNAKDQCLKLYQSMTSLEGLAPSPLSHFFPQEKGFRISLISQQKNHTGEWIWEVSSHEKNSCQPLHFTRKNAADPKVISHWKWGFIQSMGLAVYVLYLVSVCQEKLSG